MSKDWTEREVFKRLRHVFPSPAHVLIPQVRNGTGHSRKQARTADALALSVWPSRGLWMAGVEIKVSRSDWKKEFADPEKASEFIKWCHYWYVAAPVGVVPTAELPINWGLIEVEANTAKVVTVPKSLEPEKPDLLLVCSLLRSFTEHYTSNVDVSAKAEAEMKSVVETATFDLKYKLEDLQRKVDEFEKTAGVKIADGWLQKDIGKAVKLILESSILYPLDQISRLHDQALSVAHACQKIQATTRTPTTDDDEEED